MNCEPSIPTLVAAARRKGYFNPADFPHLRLTLQEMGELRQQLEKYKLPYGRPDVEIGTLSGPTMQQAKRIIEALRRGVPAAEGTDWYSVGREALLTRVAEDLSTVSAHESLVRFLNADIGQGKTHVLYLLRELAYHRHFVVSIVTLSQNSCPLYDFMAVYHDIMWGLRTADQRLKPALSNIIDRWVQDIRTFGEPRVRQIVHDELPPNLREIMAAYVAAANLFRPNETKRQLILKYLGGETVDRRDLRALDIRFHLDSSNALQILGEMAATIRYIGFKGICILFDEAEAIHSFAYSVQRDQAYANLQQIITQSRAFPHCYFLYATTPSFLENYGSTELLRQVGPTSLLELDPLGIDERIAIGRKVADIYRVAIGCEVPLHTMKAIQKAAHASASGRVGDYVRQVVTLIDEIRKMA